VALAPYAVVVRLKALFVSVGLRLIGGAREPVCRTSRSMPRRSSIRASADRGARPCTGSRSM
jgi:hypothetical protein